VGLPPRFSSLRSIGLGVFLFSQPVNKSGCEDRPDFYSEQQTFTWRLEVILSILPNANANGTFKKRQRHILGISGASTSRVIFGSINIEQHLLLPTLTALKKIPGTLS
jgi:hypothetical protein